MSRDIKFRGFVKSEEHMGSVKVLTSEGAFIIGAAQGEDTECEKLVILAPKEGRFIKNDDLALMQYTGLKDKNGKEIYEGDVVFRYENNPTSRYEVVYDNEYTAFLLTNYHASGMKIESTDEIIGNIHENPELLKWVV